MGCQRMAFKYTNTVTFKHYNYRNRNLKVSESNQRTETVKSFFHKKAQKTYPSPKIILYNLSLISNSRSLINNLEDSFRD